MTELDLDFDAPDLVARLEQLSLAQIDQLPFGVVRLSADGRVELYSKREAELSGFGDRRALGLGFFTQVAPCMDTPAFRGRLQAEARDGTVDFELGHTGDFADPSRFIRVRIRSASDGGFWLLLQR